MENHDQEKMVKIEKLYDIATDLKQIIPETLDITNGFLESKLDGEEEIFRLVLKSLTLEGEKINTIKRILG